MAHAVSFYTRALGIGFSPPVGVGLAGVRSFFQPG